MKDLVDVNILIAGTDGNTTALCFQLVNQGAHVQTRTCKEVTTALLVKDQIQLIILNHTKNGKLCENILELIHDDKLSTSIPIFTVVDDSINEIQNALVAGVADYITTTEHIDSVSQKITAVLKDSQHFSSSTAIDITPEKTEIFSTGIRVYVVEDDPLLRNLLSIKLNKSSFPHEFSKNGEGAIENMKLFKPDTIILDLMLPGISGLEILKNIKNDAQLENIPVIVFSNKDGSEERKQAEDLGADCFYVKAMTDLSELVEKIESLVLEKKS